MKFKHKLFSAVLSAFAIITFTTFVSAQETNTDKDTTQKQERREWRGRKDGMRNGMGKGMRGNMMRGFRDLNLTDDQKMQIRTIMESKRNAFQGNREEMKAIMQAKRAGTLTAEQQEKMDAFKAEMKEDAKRTHEQILGILTPEQREQLEKNKQEMKQKREERRQLREQRKQTPQTEKKDN